MQGLLIPEIENNEVSRESESEPFKKGALGKCLLI